MRRASIRVRNVALAYCGIQPGLVREPGFAGPGVEVEVWALPAGAFGQFVAQIPAPLGIGKITLSDGSAVSGFLCEAHAVADATEITKFGGWRAFLAAGSKVQP